MLLGDEGEFLLDGELLWLSENELIRKAFRTYGGGRDDLKSKYAF